MTQREEDLELLALAHARDRAFADMLCIAIGLAAKTHPETVRAALEGAFSLEAIQLQHQEMVGLLRRTESWLACTSRRANELQRRVEELERAVEVKP